MLIDIIFLLVGIFVLVKFSNITINKAARLSYLSGISQMAIGFIFIAIATSIPELSIGIISAFEGVSLLSVGNVVGANVSNLVFVFGVMAFFGFNLGRVFAPQIEFGIIITSVVAFFLIVLGGADAAFGLFCLFIFYIFASQIMKEGVVAATEKPIAETWAIIVAALQLIVAVAVVIVSAYVVTESAVKIAYLFGLSESLVGASILAMGTTLPELSVNIAAVLKKNVSLAIGDLVGSIVTNLTLVLGLVAIINPFSLESGIYTAVYMLLAINIMFIFLARRFKFGVKEGVLLLSIYVSYLVILFSGVQLVGPWN